jgi:hypothetical protein
VRAGDVGGSGRGILLQHGVRISSWDVNLGNFADLHAGTQQFDARGADAVIGENRYGGLLGAEADHDVRVLTDFHFHSRGRSLTHDSIHGQGTEHAVFDFERYAAALHNLLRFHRFLSDHVRHGHFAALNRKAHRHERAEKRDGH